MGNNHYRRLLTMAALSFVAMYALMYAVVDSWASVFTNLNQAYMAGLMTAPMVVLEMLLMRGIMCAKAPIEESAIKELCRGIIASQQAEIDQMKALLLLKQ